MIRNLTCIVCPLGCDLVAEVEDGKVLSISGNTCPRGKAYAESECTNPQRVVTSTVRCSDGAMLSVKTDRPIPKDKIFECMKIIASAKPTPPIAIGDVIIKDVFGCDIVATQNRS